MYASILPLLMWFLKQEWALRYSSIFISFMLNWLLALLGYTYSTNDVFISLNALGYALVNAMVEVPDNKFEHSVISFDCCIMDFIWSFEGALTFMKVLIGDCLLVEEI